MDQKKLINEVRLHGNLYMKGRENNRDKKKSALSWKIISQRMKLSEFECRKRWRCIRDRFVREVNKIDASENGMDDTHVEWELLPYLGFLYEHIQPKRATSSTSAAECPSPVIPKVEEPWEETMEDTTSHIDTGTFFNSRSTHMNRKQRDEDVHLRSFEQPKFVKRSPNESFLKMVGEKLNALPQDEQEECKIYILNHVFDKARKINQAARQEPFKFVNCDFSYIE